MALAIYIDLENLPKRVDFDRMMDMAASETTKHVFAVKAAYGSANALPKQYRQQLIDHNFQIVDRPHIVNKKNRADLMISIDAFERLHLNCPAIGSQMQELHKGFDFKRTRFKRLKDPTAYFENAGVVQAGNQRQGHDAD